MTIEFVKPDQDANLKRVLIVDDNFTHRKLLSEIFITHADAMTDLAGNGLEAIQAFAHGRDSGNPYDLIIMDMVMPVLGGVEATRTIRALEKQWGVLQTAETPIVFVSTQDQPPAVFSAYKQGATDYITKPYNLNRIKEIIGRFLVDSNYIDQLADKCQTEHRRGARRAYLRSLTKAFMAVKVHE